jgi:hypothetical protein
MRRGTIAFAVVATVLSLPFSAFADSCTDRAQQCQTTCATRADQCRENCASRGRMCATTGANGNCTYTKGDGTKIANLQCN